MARTPEQDAAYALNFGVSRSDLKPEAQAAYDRLVQERQQAQEERKRLIAATAWFPDLGVGVRDGNVYEHTAGMKLLGLLRERVRKRWLATRGAIAVPGSGRRLSRW